MENVTETRTPVNRPARVIDIYPSDDGKVTMLITAQHGDQISTELTDIERAALIKALGGTA